MGFFSYLECSPGMNHLNFIEEHLKLEVFKWPFSHNFWLAPWNLWCFSVTLPIQCRKDGFLCLWLIQLLTNKHLLCWELAYSLAGCYNRKHSSDEVGTCPPTRVGKPTLKLTQHQLSLMWLLQGVCALWWQCVRPNWDLLRAKRTWNSSKKMLIQSQTLYSQEKFPSALPAFLT